MSQNVNINVTPIIKSERLQNEIVPVLMFASEICKVSQVNLYLIEGSTQTILCQIETEKSIEPETIIELNSSALKKGSFFVNNTTSFYAGIPISTGYEDVNLVFCLSDSKTKTVSETEEKTIQYLSNQIYQLLQSHIETSICQRNGNQLQLYLDNSNEIVFELEIDGTINFVSKSWENLLGYEVEDYIFKNYETFIHPEDIDKCRAYLGALIEKKSNNEDITYRIKHKEGGYFWYASSLRLIVNENRNYFVGNCRNIHEFVEARLELTKQKNFYEKILNCLPTEVAVFDNNHKYLYLNPAAIRNDDLRKYIIGKDDFEYAQYTNRDPKFAQDRRNRFIEASNSDKVVEWVDEIIRNDDSKAYFTRKFAPVFDTSNQLEMMVGIGVEISAQKNAEAALKVSNERFEFSSQATSDALWDWNMITDEIFVGESYTALFGHQFPNNIIKAAECENFIHPEDREAYFKYFDEVLASTENKWTDEYRYLKSDGSYAYVCDKALIIRDDNGTPVRMIGAMQDITSEKKLKDKLQQSEEQFKGAFENSAVGMALINDEGYFIEVNQRLCEMFGYSNVDIKSKSYNEITHPEDLETDLEFKEKLDRGELGSLNLEKRFVHKNGTDVWVHMSVSIARDNKGEIKHYIVQIIDITERKNIEEQNKILIEENNRNKNIQLNEAKNMYRLLADNTVDLVCLHNLDTSFEYISPSIKKLMGYTPEDLINKFPINYVHPKDLELIQKSYTSFISEKEDEDAYLEARFLNKEGKYVWFEVKARIVKENGEPIGFQSSARNITQQKEVQYAMKKALAQERELNELRTNLVSTISHEFRTPMTTIRTSAELIEMYIEGHNFVHSKQLQKRINTITEEIDRIVELMNAVLTISKDDAGKTNFNPIQFDLKQICMDVIETSYSHHGNRKVQTHFEGKNFEVFADKNLMEYTLFNLLNNAFKYSKEENDIQLNLISSGNNIEVEIIDKGIGIPEKDVPKLFNTFFRASNTDGIQGTGLGLYIVKTFTERNSGTIQISSKLGKGTKVTLQFPTSNKI